MCQTPPRVVTHQSWVLNPNRTASHRRSTIDPTPTRPSSHQHIPTSTAANPAPTICSHWSSTAGPKIATGGTNTIAGNGANGTYTRPSTIALSNGPRA